MLCVLKKKPKNENISSFLGIEGYIPYLGMKEKNERNKIWLVDWQTCIIGCPMFDVISLFDSLGFNFRKTEEKMYFTVYIDFLRRFGIDINESFIENYWQMLDLCRILALMIELPFWSVAIETKKHLFFQKLCDLYSIAQKI